MVCGERDLRVAGSILFVARARSSRYPSARLGGGGGGGGVVVTHYGDEEWRGQNTT